MIIAIFTSLDFIQLYRAFNSYLTTYFISDLTNIRKHSQLLV